MLDVSLTPVQRHEHLFVFPLVVPKPVELPYRLLSEALAAGSLEIREKGAGSVSTLVAMNRGREDVLVLDGEQLIGAKQNRTTNRSLILLAGSTTEIPVSCMEHGRWDAGHTPFTSGLHNSPSEVRRHAREVEARNLAAGQAPSASSLSEAQGAVWGTIDETMGALGTHSGTGALNEAYTARSADIDQWLAAFSPVERQVGILAFHGRRPLGLDLLGGCALFAKCRERILHGYVLDALRQKDVGEAATAEQATGFLEQVRDAERHPAPSVGAGRYSVIADVVVGGELEHEERAAHLCAFPVEKGRSGGGRSPQDHTGFEQPIPPPSRRRRRGG